MDMDMGICHGPSQKRPPASAAGDTHTHVGCHCPSVVRWLCCSRHMCPLPLSTCGHVNRKTAPRCNSTVCLLLQQVCQQLSHLRRQKAQLNCLSTATRVTVDSSDLPDTTHSSQARLGPALRRCRAPPAHLLPLTRTDAPPRHRATALRLHRTHRATAPPFTFAPAASGTTSPLYNPLHRENSFKYERRSLNR